MSENVENKSIPLNMYKPICGVYFLKLEGVIVYVGQTINLISRIQTHEKDDAKEFDEVSYIEVAPCELAIVEMLYISKLRPRLNMVGNQSTKKVSAKVMESTLPKNYTENELISFCKSHGIFN